MSKEPFISDYCNNANRCICRMRRSWEKNGEDGEKEPVKLVFWGALPPENGPQDAVDGYKTVAPHVTIEYVRYINDEQGNIKLETALMAKEEIDVFTSYGVPARERRVAAGMCADITDLCKKYDVDLIRILVRQRKTTLWTQGLLHTDNDNHILYRTEQEHV